MGLEINASRQADLAEHSTGFYIHTGKAAEVFALIANDEDRSKQVRIYGTVTPSDIGSAWKALQAQIVRQEARQAQQQASEKRTSVWLGPKQHATNPAMLGTGKEDNQERLKRGTPDPGVPGSPENLSSWSDYYQRDYVTDAQAKAREHMKRYDD